MDNYAIIVYKFFAFGFLEKFNEKDNDFVKENSGNIRFKSKRGEKPEFWGIFGGKTKAF